MKATSLPGRGWLRREQAIEYRVRVQRHILILVENLSVPFDRRVWQESRALVDAGFEVTVICPTGAERDREREAVIEGVRILRYPLRAATGGPLGYLREYALALWHTLRLAMKVRREGPYRRRARVQPAGSAVPGRFGAASRRHAVRLRPPRPGARTVPFPAFPAAGDCSTG